MSRESRNQEESRETGNYVWMPPADVESIKKGQVTLKKVVDRLFGGPVGAQKDEGVNVIIVDIKQHPRFKNLANIYVILDTPENRAKIPLGARGETS